MMEFKGQKCHFECFLCCQCHKSLKGVPFQVVDSDHGEKWTNSSRSSTLVCQQCYDDINKAGQKPAFEVGKACAVDVFHDGNFHAAEITVVQGDGKFTVKMRDGGLKGVTLETSLVSS